MENTFFFNGDINEFNFKKILPRQYKNFIHIQTLLNTHSIYFTEITIKNGINIVYMVLVKKYIHLLSLQHIQNYFGVKQMRQDLVIIIPFI